MQGAMHPLHHRISSRVARCGVVEVDGVKLGEVLEDLGSELTPIVQHDALRCSIVGDTASEGLIHCVCVCLYVIE